VATIQWHGGSYHEERHLFPVVSAPTHPYLKHRGPRIGQQYRRVHPRLRDHCQARQPLRIFARGPNDGSSLLVFKTPDTTSAFLLRGYEKYRTVN
jgi:hypothetical protein